MQGLTPLNLDSQTIQDLKTILKVTNDTNQWKFFTDGIISFRTGIRDSALVTDKTITSLGFNGVENTDWINLIS